MLTKNKIIYWLPRILSVCFILFLSVAEIDMPVLIIHGDDDQIVPIGASAQRSAKMLKNSTLKIYRGAPHGLSYTHQDKLNNDLLEFFKSKIDV